MKSGARIAVLIAALASTACKPLGVADKRVESTMMAVASPERPVSCPGTRIPLATPRNAPTPYAEVTIGGKKGHFLIDYGATGSIVDPTTFNVATDSQISLAAPPWPGVKTPHTFTGSARTPGGVGIPSQQGVIGTDILRQSVVEMHFEGAVPFMVISASCDTSRLGQANFWWFGQLDYFSASGINASGRPNVPTVPIDWGDETGQNALEANARAQIDPGYFDGVWPHSIDINDALHTVLTNKGVRLVEVGKTTVFDCQQVGHTIPVYVTPGRALRFEDASGALFFRRESHYVIRKPAALSCGGIAAMTEPAAQLSASFLTDLGTLIFDPARAALWIKSSYVE